MKPRRATGRSRRVGRVGRVFIDREPCGILEEFDRGSRFRYDAEYLAQPNARAISFSLPLRAKPFVHEQGLHPFFENLLPEGWLLEIVLRKARLDERDHFGILLATAANCSGWASVRPLDESEERRA